MSSNITKLLILTLIAAFGLATAAFAAVPPPPVNQNLGFFDTMFNNLLEADCRVCHSTTPPPGIPTDPTYLPDRHHLNVGTAVVTGLCADNDPAVSCGSDAECLPVCDSDPATTCASDNDCGGGATGPCLIGENYCIGESERPYPSGDTMGNYDCFSCHDLVFDIPSGSFVLEIFRDCNFCHKVEFQPDHPDRTQGLNQHHRTAEARSGECSYCHGSLVQDGVKDTNTDGFADKRACDGTVSIPGQCDWIPTYQPSLVTPWPSGKNFGRCDETCDVGGTNTCSVSGLPCVDDANCAGSDTQCVIDANCPIAGEVCNLDLDGGGGGSATASGRRVCSEDNHIGCVIDADCPATQTCDLLEQGNCNFCHNATSADRCDTGTGSCVIASSTACEKDADCNGPILINHDTHHFTGATGLVPPNACNLCHPFFTPTHTTADIRTCERCHGFPSLHNIQVDSPAAGNIGSIVPGAEDPYFGHIGSNTDCNGCHGFSVAVAPEHGPVIPFIDSADDLTVTAGADTTVTLTGKALTNIVETPAPIELASTAELTASDGSVTSITPDSVTQSEMVLTLSGLSAGNYHLRAVKGTNASNPVVVAVTDDVTMTDSSCNKKKGTLTIDGSGFGEKPEGTDDYINVQVDGQTVDLISWSDTQIRASVSSCSKRATITVNALYGSASSADSGNGGGGKPDKPCKGKKC
jgi:hypothetical protein